jgi:hypothetical protein
METGGVAPYWIFIKLLKKYRPGVQCHETKKVTKKIKAITQSCLAINQTLVDI